MTCIIIIIIIIVIVIVIIMTCIPWTRPLVVVTTLSGPMSAQTLVRENKQTQSSLIIAEGDLGNILTWNFSSVNRTLPSMIIPATKLQHRVSASKKYVISRFLNFYKNVTFFGTWDSVWHGSNMRLFSSWNHVQISTSFILKYLHSP